MNKIYYVYRITNIKLKKHYYGMRATKLSPEENLGIKYFSSSSNKEFIIEQKINPQNFKYKILNIYNSKEEALALEIKLHNKFNVSTNNNFYNLARQTKSGFDVSFKIEIRDSKNILLKTTTKTGLLKWAKNNNINKEEILSVLNKQKKYLFEGKNKESLFKGYKIIKL